MLYLDLEMSLLRISLKVILVLVTTRTCSTLSSFINRQTWINSQGKEIGLHTFLETFNPILEHIQNHFIGFWTTSSVSADTSVITALHGNNPLTGDIHNTTDIIDNLSHVSLGTNAARGTSYSWLCWRRTILFNKRGNLHASCLVSEAGWYILDDLGVFPMSLQKIWSHGPNKPRRAAQHQVSYPWQHQREVGCRRSTVWRS